MKVMTKSPLAVAKEEKRVELNGDEDSGGDFAKFGCETPAHDEDRSKPSSPSQKDSTISKQVSNAYASERSSTDTTSRPSSSNPGGVNMNNQEDQLESTRAEMGEVREENERLKMVLARIMKDYQSLQMQLLNTIQQEQSRKPPTYAETSSAPPPPPNQEMEDEAELVLLSLGTSSSAHEKGDKANTSNKIFKEDVKMEGDLTLGLDCRFERSSSVATQPLSNLSPENSSDGTPKKEDQIGEQWPPSKMLKTVRSVDDDVSQQSHVKKARVSVRARCDAPTMNDGCQWRKYGQKISKGNPCPRAYYRCTVAPACPVRKQVQRCAEDMSILITTYEGTHNHPLPMAATAMASTTSAAASMLMSGSSVSRPGIGTPLGTTMTGTMAANAGLHGLNFSLSDNSRARQYYLPPNPAITTTPPYPTITLDLTSPATSTSTATTQFNRFSTNYTSPNPRYSSTSFNFSSADSTSSSPAPWSSTSGYMGYGTTTSTSSCQLYNSKNQVGSLSLGRQQTQEQFYQQSFLQKPTIASGATPPQNSLTDTIAKAITTDPTFQSALAAAITTIVGGHGKASQGVGEALSQSLKWGGSAASAISAATTGPSGNGCGATSFLNRTSSSTANQQQGNLMFLQPSLAFSNTKSTSTSPVEYREHIN